MLIYQIITLLQYAIKLYILILIASAVLSWTTFIPMNYSTRSKIMTVYRYLSKVITPVTDRIERHIKPVSFGSVSISVSYIILFFVLTLLDNALLYMKIAYISTLIP